MDRTATTSPRGQLPWPANSPTALRTVARSSMSFDADFAALFDAHYRRLWRVVDRLSGDPELAEDVVQDAFLRLHSRGALPDAPESWVITVALNLLRNARSMRQRRERLLTVARGAHAHSQPAPAPDARVMGDEVRRAVRGALDALPERDRLLLTLRAEGYSYRELAQVVGVREASVGTLLARAKSNFRSHYPAGFHDD